MGSRYHYQIEKDLALLGFSGIDVNLQDHKGCTALMRAVNSRYIEGVNALLGFSGIDVNKKNNEGDTALMLAVKYGNTDVINNLSAYLSKNVIITTNVDDKEEQLQRDKNFISYKLRPKP